MNGVSDRVVVGMDAHKRSATIEVMTGEEPSGREREVPSAQREDSGGCQQHEGQAET